MANFLKAEEAKENGKRDSGTSAQPDVCFKRFLQTLVGAWVTSGEYGNGESDEKDIALSKGGLLGSGTGKVEERPLQRDLSVGIEPSASIYLVPSPLHLYFGHGGEDTRVIVATRSVSAENTEQCAEGKSANVESGAGDDRGQQTFLKGQVEHSFGFVGCKVFVLPTQLCCCRVKVAIDNLSMKRSPYPADTVPTETLSRSYPQLRAHLHSNWDVREEGLILWPSLEWSSMITTYCNLYLLGSRDPPTSPWRVSHLGAAITEYIKKLSLPLYDFNLHLLLLMKQDSMQ
ncbi:hypothetical protein AAY473_008995, partial [Plecturocebus cupreus]